MRIPAVVFVSVLVACAGRWVAVEKEGEVFSTPPGPLKKLGARVETQLSELKKIRAENFFTVGYSHSASRPRLTDLHKAPTEAYHGCVADPDGFRFRETRQNILPEVRVLCGFGTRMGGHSDLPNEAVGGATRTIE